MKTQAPTIAVKQDITKTKKDGTAPLYIHINWRCTRAKESTGVYLNEKDFKRGMWKKNNAIKKRLNEVDERATELLDRGLDFTASDCLKRPNSKVNPLSVVLDMAKVKKLEEGTVKGYTILISSLKKYYGDDFLLTDLTLHNIQGYARATKVTPTTMCGYLKRLSCLLTYATERGIIKENVMIGWRFKSEGYKQSDNPKARDKGDVTVIWDAFENSKNKLIKEAAGIWCSGFYFCGLALTDLIDVDWDKVDEVVIGQKHYYHTTVYRNKTREMANIMTPKWYITEKLMEFLRSRPWDGATKEQYTAKINRSLKKIFPDLTYYQARHTFCTQLVNSNVALSDIATLMGRNVSGIGTYIKQVTKTEHLATAANAMIDAQLFDTPDFDDD